MDQSSGYWSAIGWCLLH